MPEALILDQGSGLKPCCFRGGGDVPSGPQGIFFNGLIQAEVSQVKPSYRPTIEPGKIRVPFSSRGGGRAAGGSREGNTDGKGRHPGDI